MDSTLLATTTLLGTSKTLNSSSNPFISRLPRHFSAGRPSQCLRSQLVSLQIVNSKALSSISYSSNSLRSLGAVAVIPVGSRLERVASSAASFASAAGGGGDAATDGGEAKSNSVVGGSEEVSALSPDVIILDVGGMTCGGCAASVKRILESQPQVSSASVNLTTETAMVWTVSEAQGTPNWKKNLGETLAKHVTSCGFNSTLRGQGAIEGDIPS